MVREGLAQQPDSPDAVLLLARLLLESRRNDEALAVIRGYAGGHADDTREPATGFAGVSDSELDLAFERAESDREHMLDADAIAQRAIRQTDPVIEGVEAASVDDDDFVTPDASYATRTVASLLERQGAAPTASKVRAIVDSSTNESAPRDMIRDRRMATVMELERWLVNLRGVSQ